MIYELRNVPGLPAPAWVVAAIQSNGVVDDIAWFYLIRHAQEYIDWKNGLITIPETEEGS